MAIRDLKTQITRLPEQPGVYLYFNDAGDTLYVGRARALRDRVRSYLSAYGSSPKTNALLDEVTRLEVIVTDSLVEALALENHLIKQRAPRFNIVLRDDTLPIAEIVDFLRDRPLTKHICITGRDAKPELVELADLVTEFGEVKHPFHAGFMAQKGVEY